MVIALAVAAAGWCAHVTLHRVLVLVPSPADAATEVAFLEKEEEERLLFLSNTQLANLLLLVREVQQPVKRVRAERKEPKTEKAARATKMLLTGASTIKKQQKRRHTKWSIADDRCSFRANKKKEREAAKWNE